MIVKIDELSAYEVPDPVVKRMQEYYDAMTEANRRLDELKGAVQQMRDTQKLYFKSPKAFNLLDDAKAAEKVVDRLLAGKPVQETSKQNSMF